MSEWFKRAAKSHPGIKLGEILLISSSKQTDIERIFYKPLITTDDCDMAIDYIIENEHSAYFRIKFLILLVKAFINASYATAYGVSSESIKPILDITDTWEDEWYIVLASSVNKNYIGNNKTIENYSKIIS